MDLMGGPFTRGAAGWVINTQISTLALTPSLSPTLQASLVAAAVAATKSNAATLTSPMATVLPSPVLPLALTLESLLSFVRSTHALASILAINTLTSVGAVATAAAGALTLICLFGLLKSLQINLKVLLASLSDKSPATTSLPALRLLLATLLQLNLLLKAPSAQTSKSLFNALMTLVNHRVLFLLSLMRLKLMVNLLSR
jgi:hypothetical protein